MSDEVELPGNDDDEYEIIPMGPVRKLEKRIKELESERESGGTGNSSLVRDILDIMKANQKIVNDMVESTDQLHNSVDTLTTKMDTVIDNMNSFIELLEEASETSLEEDVSTNISQNLVTPIQQTMEDLHATNEKMLKGLAKIDDSIGKLDKRMKRMYVSSRGGRSGRRRESRGGQ